METNPGIEKKLRLFARLLAEANERVRLVGPSDENVIYEEHIKDALAASRLLGAFPPGSRFADIGTGGGIPGTVWCVSRPNMEGVMADSVGKKIRIAREISEALGLSNATFINARSEELASREREAFDAASARAVADSRVTAEYLAPLVKVGGILIVFKGAKVHEEIGLPAPLWRKLGLGAPSLVPYSMSGKKLYLLTWEKIAPCPVRFPRKPGEAKRDPWWAKQ
ncbi:MAG: 16S rRNA (guanine(527)-N(7))-methyltransferase RsmG [Synergistaceae bacterium]|jgi:16S rRNA (guanine527-N7)-methyltransferase|nr:16S rRNA (guanine(527)-N(7))-methyltransferase RsmG [Synergistaceae bacterium]